MLRRTSSSSPGAFPASSLSPPPFRDKPGAGDMCIGESVVAFRNKCPPSLPAEIRRKALKFQISRTFRDTRHTVTATESRPFIVVGVDGSQVSREALQWAANQVQLSGAELRAVIAWR